MLDYYTQVVGKHSIIIPMSIPVYTTKLFSKVTIIFLLTKVEIDTLCRKRCLCVSAQLGVVKK